MNKVILINSLSSLDFWERRKAGTEQMISGTPLAMLSLGTALSRAGYSVRLIDPMVDEDYLDTIDRELDGALWVGISTMTNGVASALHISRHIKRVSSDIPVCWGGVHPTLFTQSVAAADCVDFVCWGEGERFVVELSRHLQGEMALDQIEGVGYSLHGDQHFVPRTYFLDIETFGVPDYDLLDMDRYMHLNLGSLSTKCRKGQGKFVAVNTGIGCPYRCTFCWNTHPSQKYRTKSAGLLLENIDLVVSKFDPDVIHLQDDLFFADKSRFFTFLDEYDRRGYRFQWMTNCRMNYINDSYLNDEVLARIADQCIWLGCGVESGSDSVRQKLDKQLTADAIYSAAAAMGRNGIVGGYAFMTGLPYEKVEDTVETVKMIKRIKELNPFARFAFQCYRPYPGSPLYEEAVASGFVPPCELDGWALLQEGTNVGMVKRDILPWLDSDALDYFEGVVRSFNRDSDVKVLHSSRNEIGRTGYLAGRFFFWLRSVFFKASFGVRNSLKWWSVLSLETAVARIFLSMDGARRIYGALRTNNLQKDH